jgi:Tfp pilus assembly protein PilE
MALKTEYIVGNQTETEWAGIYGYTPDEEKDLNTYGQMFAVIRVSTGSEDFATEKFGKFIVNELQQSYFWGTKESDSILMRLENACWEMKSKMNMILSREADIADMGIDMEMAIVVLRENYLYAVTIGESKIYIEREGELVDISEGLVDLNNSNFIKSGSLAIESTDKFCIATSKSLEFGEDSIDESLSELDINKLMDLAETSGASLMLIADDSLEWAELVEKKIANLQRSAVGSEQLREVIDQEEEDKNKDELNQDEIEDQGDIDDDRILEMEDELSEDEITDEEEMEMEKISLKDRLSEKAKMVKTKTLPMLKNAKIIVGNKTTNLKNKLSRKKDLELDEQTEIEDIKDDNEIENYEEIPKRRKSDENEEIIDRKNKTTIIYLFNRAKIFLQNLIEKLKIFFRKEILGKTDNRRVVDKKRIKRNRWIMVIIVIVFSFVIYNSFQNARENSRQKEILAANTTKVEDFEEQLSRLTAQVTTASASSANEKQTVLNQIKQLETTINSTTNIAQESSSLVPRIDTLKTNILAQKDKLLLIEEVKQPAVLVDVAAQLGDVNLTDIEYSEGFIFVSDSTRNVIYRIANQLNSLLETHISNVVEPQILAKNAAGEIIVYDNDTQNVLSKFNPIDKDSLTRFAGTTPQTIGKATDATVYDVNDSAYEIRQNHKQIFRRDKAGSDYGGGGAIYEASNPPNWKTDQEIAQAIDVEVQYQVYVLVQGLGLRRYLSGGANNLTFENFNQLLKEDFDAINSATAFDVTLKYIAIADSVNSRIMLFEVEGEDGLKIKLLKQFVYRGTEGYFKNIKELQINESEKQVYILDGARVIKLDF